MEAYFHLRRLPFLSFFVLVALDVWLCVAQACCALFGEVRAPGYLIFGDDVILGYRWRVAPGSMPALYLQHQHESEYF